MAWHVLFRVAKMACDVLFEAANLWGRLCPAWPKTTSDVSWWDVLSCILFWYMLLE